MYLPKSKYTVQVAAPGQFSLNGESYVGPMIVDYKGRMFAGPSPDKIKGTLVRSTVDVQNVAVDIPVKRVPTDEEYVKGSMERYFRRDNRNGKVIEMQTASVSEKPWFSYASASWILTGSVEDIPFKINGRNKPVTIPGVRTKNKATVDRLEQELPGISGSVLVDAGEFVITSEEAKLISSSLNN